MGSIARSGLDVATDLQCGVVVITTTTRSLLQQLPVEAILDEGVSVRIQGLQRMPALNGTVGCVLGFDGAAQRYKIQIEDGSVKKFKRCNLVLEEDIEDDDNDDNCLRDSLVELSKSKIKQLYALDCNSLDMIFSGSSTASSSRH